MIPQATTLIRAVRLHQWAKNLLILLPLITSHQVFDEALLRRAGWAFLAFGLCASASYLFNDLLDRPADRRHPAKRERPLASGAMSPALAVVLIALLLAAGIACARLLPPGFLGVLLLYLLCTGAYSLWLKRVVLLDAVLLATLYALRIVAGNMASGIEISEWLIALSVFFFFSLALMKRFSELRELRGTGGGAVGGRGYHANDLEFVGALGIASGFVAVLVFALYITTERMRVLYTHPNVLWAVCLVMLYWTSRTWLVAWRGEMHVDPVVFALTDKVSYLVGVLVLAIIALASGAIV